MKRSLILSICAVVAVSAFAGLVQAQTATLSLDLFYRGNDAANNGTWQLYAKGDSQGISGIDSQIGGIVGATNETFLAPDGTTGFLTSIGSVAYNGDQDSDAATLDMLFGQLPTNPASLIYNAANITKPLLGSSVDTSGSSVAGGLLLAYGTFGAGSAPALTTGAPAGGNGANVFTTVGTASAAGTIVEAAMTTQVRGNAAGKAADANLDGDVDVFQFNGGGDAQIFNSNNGCSAANGDVCLWQDGDFNGDRDVDVFQFNGQGDAQILNGNLGTDAAAGTASATYDFLTGELSVDVGSGVAIVGFETEDLFVTSGNSPKAGADAAQFDNKVLAFFTTDTAGLPVGVFSLGAVLPAGLSASDVLFGYSPVGGANVPMDVAVINNVPEPTTFVMLGLALLAGAATRKRAA